MVGKQTWFSDADNNANHAGKIWENRNEHKWMGRISMFIAGFIMLTPHRIAMTCAPHILKRYHLPPDVVPLFIYKIHAPMELGGLVGQLLTNIIAWIVRATRAYRSIFRGFSILSAWSLFFSGILSFVLLYSGDDYGNFNYFFWSIILMTFTNGLYCASAFKLEGFIASMYGAGIPSSGFFTFFLHKFCKLKSKRDGWADFDRNILLVQYWVTVITLGLSTIWWTIDITFDIIDNHKTKDENDNTKAIDYGNHGDDTGARVREENNMGILELFEGGHAADWSPIGMLAASLGSVYFFYPSISPYSLADPDVGKKIDLWVQFTAAIPNFGAAILDIIGETVDNKFGPSGKHWYKTGSRGDSGNKYYYLWHLSWLAFIPYVLCIYIFLSLMHFPDGWISRKINGNPIVIGLIGNTFNFFQEWMESIGFAGAGAQTSDTSNPFNDDIAAFNVLFTYVFMIISMVIRDLYMRIFEGKMK